MARYDEGSEASADWQNAPLIIIGQVREFLVHSPAQRLFWVRVDLGAKNATGAGAHDRSRGGARGRAGHAWLGRPGRYQHHSLRVLQRRQDELGAGPRQRRRHHGPHGHQSHQRYRLHVRGAGGERVGLYRGAGELFPQRHPRVAGGARHAARRGRRWGAHADLERSRR